MSIIHQSPLSLPTWELKSQSWVESRTVYRNTLHQVLHGSFAEQSFIIDASGYEDPNEMAQALRDNLPPGSVFDCATGSRKHALFMGYLGKEPPSSYYLPNVKRVSHGSILFSECREMHDISGATIKVLDDEDTKVVQKHGLGDCHGLISYSLYLSLRYPDGCDKPVYSPIQFRLGSPTEWVAKGTLMPAPPELMGGADLLLAKSSFKGHCPAVGKKIKPQHLYLGVFSYANKARYKTSHSVVGWFQSKEARSFLLEQSKKELQSLLALRGDTPAILKKFIESQTVPELDEDGEVIRDEQGNEVRTSIDLDNPSDRVVEYWRYALVLNGDKYNALQHHPRTAEFINKLMRQMYFDAATGKFLPATGLMASPMPSLKPGYVLSHSLPAGEYVYWRYPVRHYGDIRIVTIVNPANSSQEELDAAFQSKPTAYDHTALSSLIEGTFWINPDYFLEVGGDFDGDNAVFLNASMFPALANEVKVWKRIPEIEKPAKVPSTDSLELVAAKSASNRVALFMSMMYACRTLGLTAHYSKLGEQIQLEVDSFKSGLSIDEKFIGALAGQLKGLAKGTPWYRWYKNEELFLSSADFRCPYTDTISFLLNQACDLWKSGVEGNSFSPFTTRPYWSYRDLFSVDVPDSWLSKARTYFAQYREEMSAALVLRRLADKEQRKMTQAEQELTSHRVRTLLDKWKEFADGLREKNTEETMITVAVAFWKAWHSQHTKKQDSKSNNPMENGTWTASLCFSMFYQEIISLLGQASQANFRCWKDTSRHWDDTVLVKVVRVSQDKWYLATKDGASLRIITDKGQFPPEGTEFPAHIKSHVNVRGEVSYLSVSLGSVDDLDF